MLGPFARISNNLGRNVMQNAIRHHGSHGGVPGENLPFQIASRGRLSLNFFLFVGSGLAAPFLIMFHQVRKNST